MPQSIDNGVPTQPSPLKGALMLEISAALAAMRGAFELTKVAIEARDDAKIKAALAEMASNLMDANMVALGMSEKLRTLETDLSQASSRIRDLEQSLKKRESYCLFEVRPGAFVYSYQPIAEDKTPLHYKCQACFDVGKDSVLVKNLDGTNLICNIDNGHTITLFAKDYSALLSRNGNGWNR